MNEYFEAIKESLSHPIAIVTDFIGVFLVVEIIIMVVVFFINKRHVNLWKTKSSIKLTIIFVVIGYIIQLVVITIFNILLRHNVPIPG